jgi:hypothetical protein
MPPRAQWTIKPATPPLTSGRTNLSPIQASPIDQGPSTHARRPSVPDTYYEDVDPRFAESSPSSMPLPSSSTGAFVPHSLQNGGPRGPPMDSNHLSPGYAPGGGQDLRGMQDPSMESLQEGQRSPAASDASHYTSVSQRGVNPNWRPPPGQNQRRGPPRTDDVVLNSNPEFSLPGIGPSGRGGRGAFRGRGGSGMGPMRGGGPMGGLGPASGGGRYPAP